MSMPDQLKMVRQLSDDWQKTVRPIQGLLAQADRMKIGLEMAQSGDLLAGSQAILISFNKLLDPTSGCTRKRICAIRNRAKCD